MINLKKLRKSKGLTLDDILKRRIEMKEIEVGTKVLVRAEVDAFRTGLNSGSMLRAVINGQRVWLRPEDIQLMHDDVESILGTDNQEDGVTEREWLE